MRPASSCFSAAMASSRCSVETYSSLPRVRLAEARVQNAPRCGRAQLGLGAAGPSGRRRAALPVMLLEAVDGDPELLEHRDRAALGLLEQRAQQMDGARSGCDRDSSRATAASDTAS